MQGWAKYLCTHKDEPARYGQHAGTNQPAHEIPSFHEVPPSERNCGRTSMTYAGRSALCRHLRHIHRRVVVIVPEGVDAGPKIGAGGQADFVDVSRLAPDVPRCRVQARGFG